MKECVTHHHACDCREKSHMEEVDHWKQRAEAAEAKLRELEMQEPVGNFSFNDQNNLWQQVDADWAKKEPFSSTPLYAKPFPAPKQEEK